MGHSPLRGLWVSARFGLHSLFRLHGAEGRRCDGRPTFCSSSCCVTAGWSWPPPGASWASTPSRGNLAPHSHFPCPSVKARILTCTRTSFISEDSTRLCAAGTLRLLAAHSTCVWSLQMPLSYIIWKVWVSYLSGSWGLQDTDKTLLNSELQAQSDCPGGIGEETWRPLSGTPPKQTLCFFQGVAIPINHARPNHNMTRKEPIG